MLRLAGVVRAHSQYARWPQAALILQLGFELIRDCLLVYSPYLIGPIDPLSEISPEFIIPSSLFLLS